MKIKEQKEKVDRFVHLFFGFFAMISLQLREIRNGGHCNGKKSRIIETG